MEEERWVLLSDERRETRVRDALLAVIATAEVARQKGTLLEQSAYVYPTSLGEWLGHGVELAGNAFWQAPFVPMLLPDGGRRSDTFVARRNMVPANQGAGMVVRFGAALWSALMVAAELPLGQSDAAEAVEDAIIAEGLAVLDEVRAEHNGCSSALNHLGSAVFVLAAHLERGGEPDRQAIGKHLNLALSWLTAAIATTDVLELLGLASGDGEDADGGDG